MNASTSTQAGASAPAIRRPFVLAAVMAASFMIAIEATNVSTAMPQIAGQLGELLVPPATLKPKPVAA